MFVGEIGIPRREFLYELSFWEARSIYRGYRNRYRDMWSAVRWHAYRIMGTFADLRKAGIYGPSDLIKFPWDGGDNEEDLPTDEEINKMREMIQQENNAIK